MKREILDNELINEKEQNSKYSFYCGLASLFIMAIMTGFTYLRMSNKISTSLNSGIQTILLILFLVVGITGIQYSIKTIRKRESNSSHKIIGIIFNSIVFILILSTFISVLFDLNKFF